MRTKVKTYKVKNSEKEAFITHKRAFLWQFVKEDVGSKKSKVTLARGPETVINKKGLKKVKKYEKWYVQLQGKRAPIAGIIFTLFFLGALIPIFVIDIPVVKVVLIGASSILGTVMLFVWFAYLMTMLKKKKVSKYLIAEAHKYDAKPEEVISPTNTTGGTTTSGEEEQLEPEPVAEAYLQGDEK